MSSEAAMRAVSSVWRTLRSMRTALYLLLVLALASVAGSLVPQVPISPAAVREIYVEHPLRARIFEGLGLFDVYGSWWFTLAYVLLLISLGSCLVPRSRAMLRGLRRRPEAMRELEGMRHFVEAPVSGTPDDALARSRRVLRRRRFRVAKGVPGLAAEKGSAREAGSLLFHWSFFVLLVGVVVGKGFGLVGRATIVEGETWTEAHANYDLPPAEGRFFTEAMHEGFGIRLLDFDARYHENGVPETFVSRVEILNEAGSAGGNEEIRVNEPLEVDGTKLYQFGFGWAPVLEVRHEGRALQHGPVVFVTDAPDDPRLPWRGVVKLPSLSPQVGIELTLYPDPLSGFGGAPMLEARDPFIAYRIFRGDLGLDTAQSVFTLDKSDLVAVPEEERGVGGVGLGEEARLPGGVTLAFPELREYTQLQLKRDPGLPLLLISAVLILAGLIPALYSSRRRIWVRAFRRDGETRIQVAGFALQRRAAFEDEFREIASELAGEPRERTLVG